MRNLIKSPKLGRVVKLRIVLDIRSLLIEKSIYCKLQTFINILIAILKSATFLLPIYF